MALKRKTPSSKRPIRPVNKKTGLNVRLQKSDIEVDRSSILPAKSREEAQVIVYRFKRNTAEFSALLAKIVLERLWEVMGYKSFRDFWAHEIRKFSYSYLARLRQAIELQASLEPGVKFGVIPEHTFRSILAVVEEDRKRVWREAKRLAGGLEAITTETIQEAIQKTQAKPLRPAKPARSSQRLATQHKQLTQKLARDALRMIRGNNVTKEYLKALTDEVYIQLCKAINAPLR